MAQQLLQRTLVIWYINGDKLCFTVGQENKNIGEIKGIHVDGNEAHIVGAKGFYRYLNLQMELMEIYATK